MTAALARAHMLSGEDSAAARIAEQALVPAELAENMPVLVDALITRATALSSLGRVREGTALLKGAIDLADTYQLPRAALRAINNLLDSLGADDRRDASRMQTAGLEQARRIGDRFWIVRFAFFVAMDLIEEGRYDQAMALLNEFDPNDMDHMNAGFFTWGAHRIALLRGAVGARERAVEAISKWQDDPDPQTAATWQWVAVEIALRSGDFADACDRALRIDHGFIPSADHLHLAAEAAFWLRDADRVNEISKVLTGLPIRGRMIRGIHRLLSAGRSALVNDMDQAASGFRELIELWKQVGMPIQTAETQALFAALVGQDDPEARAAAKAAYQWIQSSGANRLLELWAPGLPRPAVAATG